MNNCQKKAQEYIDKYKQNSCCSNWICYGATGPTGPTGPAGPISLEIAAVETGQPNTEAQVVNLGDEQNVKLEFIIPMGMPGPTGPQGEIGSDGLPGPQGEVGPTGPQGKDGPPVQIVIGNIQTVDAGSDANVVDTGSGELHVLNFEIPRGFSGPIGPMGPTGPAGTSVTILGSFSSEEELRDQKPTGNLGDSYLVGDNLYVWNDTLKDWQDVGVIRGPAGPQGDIGPIGPQGPRGIQGPQGIQGNQGLQGEIGPTGPTGPAGPEEIGVVYFVTFNDEFTDGETVYSGHRIPIARKEVDNTDMCVLNDDDTISFKKNGVYRVEFIVNVFGDPVSEFNPDVDIVSIGFKKVFERIIYAGGSSWITNKGSIQIVGQGVFLIDDPVRDYMELVNLSKQPIVLNTPSLTNISSQSYFANSLVTIVIQYLG